MATFEKNSILNIVPRDIGWLEAFRVLSLARLQSFCSSDDMLVHSGDDCLTNLNWLVQPNNFPPLNPATPPPYPNGDYDSDICNPNSNGSNNHQFLDYKREAIKPPYSYAQLITMAMEAHGRDKVLLTDIYAWIKENFFYFKSNDTSWQNSVRHNLSLNKQFIKVPRETKDKGKGSYWMLDPKTKDPYCLRRRNFAEPQQRRSNRPEVSRPQVNPAVKSFLETNRRLQESRRHPFSGAGETVEDIGAQECVYTDADPMFDDFNQKLFKKEVESYDPIYQPNIAACEALNSSQEPRVRVEYLWENYEFHPSTFTGAQLPLEPESRNLDLRIPTPTPEWWGNSMNPNTNLLLSPSSNNPLAKVFENLTCSTNGMINNNFSNNINNISTPINGRRENHPWSDRHLQEANLHDGDILDLDYSKVSVDL